MAALENVLGQHLEEATKVLEQQVDAEIDRLDKLDDDDIEMLRRKRMQQMQKSQQQKQEWLALGHGQYEELPDEKAFFDATKKSKNVVCHFYRDSTERCKIVDKHLVALAQKHLETRFVKINAEKSKFLTDRLRIKVLPTICLAKNGKTVDYVVGFDELGGRDDFSTEVLEWRLAHSEVIVYKGDLSAPPTSGMPTSQKKSLLGPSKKKIIRGRDDDSDDDDDY